MGRSPVAKLPGVTGKVNKPIHHMKSSAPDRPDTTKIQQFGVNFGLLPVWGWTVSALVGALEAHNVGDFSLSGRLAHDMASNPWIRHGLNTRNEFVTTCPLNFTPAGKTAEEQRRSKRCCDFVREAWRDIMPTPTLRNLHRQELLMGQGLFAMDWREERDGRDRWWLPYVKPWEPTLSAYRQFVDPDSIDGGGFVATTLSHGQLRVVPGAGRWGMFSRSSLRPWLDGIVRVLGEAFTGDGYNFRDNMTHQDRWGRGIVKLMHPVNWRQAEVNACAASLTEGGGGGVLQCPTGPDGKPLVDAELLRADGAGYQTFDATEKRILRRVLIALLRQDMTTTGTTGIADNDPRQMSLWKCREEDAETYGDARCSSVWQDVGSTRRLVPVWEPCNGPIREQITRWIAYFNFGDMDLAPYVWWDATPPDDYETRMNAMAQRAQQFGGAISSVGSAFKSGLPADYDYVMEQIGINPQRLPDDPKFKPGGNTTPPPPAPKAGAGGATRELPAAAVVPALAEVSTVAAEVAEIERSALTVDGLDGVQVRISAAGAPFHPGHTPGIDNHGLLHGGGHAGGGGGGSGASTGGGKGASGGGGGMPASGADHAAAAHAHSVTTHAHAESARGSATVPGALAHAGQASKAAHAAVAAAAHAARLGVSAQHHVDSAHKAAAEAHARVEHLRLTHTSRAHQYATEAAGAASLARGSQNRAGAQRWAQEASHYARRAEDAAAASGGHAPAQHSANEARAHATAAAEHVAHLARAEHVRTADEHSRNAHNAAQAARMARTAAEAQRHATEAQRHAEQAQAARVASDHHPTAVGSAAAAHLAAQEAARHAAEKARVTGGQEHVANLAANVVSIQSYARTIADNVNHIENATNAAAARVRLADVELMHDQITSMVSGAIVENIGAAQKYGHDVSAHMATVRATTNAARASLLRAREAAARHTSATATRDEAHRFFGEDKNIDFTALSAAFSAPGHFTAVQTAGYVTYDGRLRAEFKLVDGNGQHVGRVERVFTKKNGVLSVYHAFFELDRAAQGQGGAKTMFKNAVEMYQKAGVKAISVTAGLDKGRYVWASFGFKAKPSEVANYRNGFENRLRREADEAQRRSTQTHDHYTQVAYDDAKRASFAARAQLLRGALEKTRDIKSMQDIADFTHGGERLGKEFLINAEHMPMWHGTIRMSKTDAGFKRLRERIGMADPPRAPRAPRRPRATAAAPAAPRAT